MRILAGTVGVLLALVLLAAAVGPRLLDDGAERAFVEAEFARLIGAPVEVRGAVDIELLPRPRAVLAQVSVPDRGLVAERVAIVFDVAALLRGQVIGENVRLRNARIALPDDFSIDTPALERVTDLRLERTEITYRGVAFAVEEGRVTRSGDGDLAGRADGTLAGRRAQVDFALASGGAGGARLLSTSLDGPGNARLRLNGVLSHMPGGPRLVGRLDARGEDAGALGVAAGLDRMAWSLASQIDLSPAALLFNEASVSIGESSATGAVTWRGGAPPRLDIVLQVGRLDGDRVWRQPELRQLDLDRLLPASDLVLTLGATVAAATLADAVIQQVRLDLAAVDGAVVVEHFSALLPGGAELSLSGRLGRDGNRTAFAGRLVAAADNARALLDWGGVSVAGLAADRLRRVELQAAVSLDAAVAELTELDLTLDATRITGVAAVALRARPSFSVDLQADRLNFDAYLPLFSTGGAPLAQLVRFDTNARVRVGQLSFAGEPLADAELDASLLAGKLHVERAAADLAGGSIALAGDGLIAPSGAAAWEMQIKAEGDDFARFLRAFGIAPDHSSGPRFGLETVATAELDRVALNPLALAFGDGLAGGALRWRLAGEAPALTVELEGAAAGAIAAFLERATLPPVLPPTTFRFAGEQGPVVLRTVNGRLTPAD